ncbi:penicillin acylase family protein [Paracoccus zhejiangensis]|uniref:Penicillin acylase family protein n=1 Tax=Paracoccus zhejiangensis TaxID=1077935 RepID=A0A2H5EU95_9RHOB|nr:penicillin acylase family protein [Paracoccus zhejiangensis]AUH62875.1 penicillin acylase family protein [Paracoccus zhejiangensis]
MLTLFRWLLRLTVGLILVMVIATVLVWYFATRSLPDYNANYQMAGLSGPVEIVRSTENVPHIFGASDADVFFALGVAHAQDRLFQMTVLRRAAQGRLAEIYGASAFRGDDLARRLGLYRHARESLAAQDDYTKAALEAYSAGVNEWIAQINRDAAGRGAPEFFLFPDEIAAWKPADSLAVLKLVAATSSSAIRTEVLNARLSIARSDIGPQLAALPGDAPLPDYASLFPGARLMPPAPDADAPSWDEALAGYLDPGLGLSATAFAAAPDRTAAQGSILANSPEGPLTAPSLWYLARLELQQGGVIGGTIPGIPAVLSGRNTGLAWGVTPAGIDDADLFIEELQPGDITRHRGVDGWTDFTSRREVIRIRDGEDQPITLRWTANGAVLPGVDFDLADVTPRGHVAALAWTGASDDDATMSGLIGLMRAPDRSTAATALAQVTTPALQVTMADRDGVGQQLAGRAPRRDTAHPTGGRMPAPGWEPASSWQGLAPAAEILGSALPGQAGADGIVLATGEGAVGPRLARLTRLAEDREVQSRDSFIAIQLDVVSPAARSLLPLVGADLWFTGEPAATGTPERQRQDALNLLAEWDGEMNEHLPEPAIYSAWMLALQDRLIRDELGPLSEDITALYPSFIEAVFRNRNGAAAWCDVAQSAPVEDCATIARQSLDAAILDLTDRYGPDVTTWRWGDVHVATQFHPSLGHLPGLSWVVNLSQSTSGDGFTLAQGGLLGSGANPFRNVTGAGYRGVYDLADPDSSVFIISTGQSGHPLSRHYDDLAELWRRGEYIGMSLDPELARAAATGITRLTPPTE